MSEGSGFDDKTRPSSGDVSERPTDVHQAVNPNPNAMFNGRTGTPLHNYNGQSGLPESETPTLKLPVQKPAVFGQPRTDANDQRVLSGEPGEITQPVRVPKVQGLIAGAQKIKLPSKDQ